MVVQPIHRYFKNINVDVPTLLTSRPCLQTTVHTNTGLSNHSFSVSYSYTEAQPAAAVPELLGKARIVNRNPPTTSGFRKQQASGIFSEFK